jgi:hypothetical protein
MWVELCNHSFIWRVSFAQICWREVFPFKNKHSGKMAVNAKFKHIFEIKQDFTEISQRVMGLLGPLIRHHYPLSRLWSPGGAFSFPDTWNCFSREV